jgi:hypothetical protein
MIKNSTSFKWAYLSVLVSGGLVGYGLSLEDTKMGAILMLIALIINLITEKN